MADPNGFDILTIGLGEDLLTFASPILGQLKSKALVSSAEVEAFLEAYELKPGTVVLISTETQGMSHFEVGQALGSYFQGLNLVFLTMDRAQFDLGNLKKNGFTESFLFPLDKNGFVKCVEDIQSQRLGGGSKKYKAVKLVDIQAGQKLPFEVKTYLPTNNKYVTLTGHGELSQKKFEMLKQRSSNSVFIDSQQIEKFYDFAADQLMALGESSNDAVSQTEKAERMQASVRGLFRSVLDVSDSSDFESGRDLLEQSKKVVEGYVKKKTGLDLKEKLQSLIGEGADSYSHAQIVSTIACLLSMASGIGNSEDLAIAGLFHDIGVLGLSSDISVFDIDQLNEVDKEKYKQHPRLSLNMLREKKITVTTEIAEIIEKHHERVDGKGFPAQLPAHKIPLEAQILAYADAFEYLTRFRPGQPVLPISEVHKIIASKAGLSNDLLLKLEKFLNEVKSQSD